MVSCFVMVMTLKETSTKSSEGGTWSCTNLGPVWHHFAENISILKMDCAENDSISIVSKKQINKIIFGKVLEFKSVVKYWYFLFF